MKRRERPVPAAHPQPLPAALNPALLCRWPGPGVYRARRAPSPAPCLALPELLPRGTPPPARSRTSLRKPWSFGSHWEPQVAPREPAASSLQEDALSPAPSQPTRSSPTGQPSRALFSSTHRWAALGSPASGRPDPARDGGGDGGRGGGGGGTAERAGRTPGARRRTGALAPALPHRLPLRTPTRTRGRRAPSRLRGGRERGSARNPWNEAPPALSRALPGSAWPARTRPRTRPSHRAGGRPSPGERARRRGRGLARRGEACFPSPARRTPCGDGSHVPSGCRRARAGNGCCGTGAALGPREEAPVPEDSRTRHLTHIYAPQGSAGGNTPSAYPHKRTFRARPGACCCGPGTFPTRTQWAHAPGGHSTRDTDVQGRAVLCTHWTRCPFTATRSQQLPEPLSTTCSTYAALGFRPAHVLFSRSSHCKGVQPLRRPALTPGSPPGPQRTREPPAHPALPAPPDADLDRCLTFSLPTPPSQTAQTGRRLHVPADDSAKPDDHRSSTDGCHSPLMSPVPVKCARHTDCPR
uniref:proline-rich protein 36-like n=1 Tax=Odobenus rosmarus divergens TaxID=9708 RepID=UPI00063C3924|nr:PREDICTED: proline-rich protein 36-like [Odobenus rosmarus divergens]